MSRVHASFHTCLSLLICLAWASTSLAQAPTISFNAPSDETRICSNLLSINPSISWTSTTSWSERYEYRPEGATAWTLIAQFNVAPTGPSPFNGQRVPWTIPGGVGPGRLYLRATLSNNLGTSTAVTSIYLVRSPPTLTLLQPAAAAKLRGVVLFTGSVNDPAIETVDPTITIEQRLAFSGAAFAAVTPGGPGLPPALGSWDTTTVPDGSYQIRVIVANACGYSFNLTRTVEVNNSTPIIGISSPGGCDTTAQPVVTVRGRNDTGQSWILDYALANGAFTPIATGTGPIAPGSVIGLWNVAALPRCLHTLRLRATNQHTDWTGTPGSAETLLPVDLRCAVDFDRGGSRTIDDIFLFINAWFAGCP